MPQFEAVVPSPLELPCPACDTPIVIAPRELTEGSTERCLHCGAEAALSREWDVATHRYHWTLIDPEDQPANER